MIHTQLQGSQTHHIQGVINSMNLSISCTRLAGRMLTKDQCVLQTVGGYQLDLLRTPHQYQVPNQIKTTRENSSLVTLEVTELLSKRAIVETQLTPHNFISQIFLVEKKDGGQRPVINLKGLKVAVKRLRAPHNMKPSNKLRYSNVF